MILQSIANSLRKQDWGTLGIELVVVVIGIFLGLQVDDWNEARKEAIQEKAYLERLLADTGEMISAHEAHSVDAQDKLAHIISSLDALRTCELPPEVAESLDLTLLNHQGLPRIPVIRSGYDELVSSGALTRIDDLELKNRISEAFAFSVTAQDFVEYFTADLGRASGIIWQHVSFHIKPDADAGLEWDTGWRGEDYSQTVSYDFPSLCQSHEFINAMVEVFDSTKDRLGIGGEFANQLRELKELLLQRLNRAAD